ncbi:hypothetical protein C8Q74DRAFT_132054 [Fomes fomentarius]|nr:hypothetical protein C8Q74DRAFT_132054 [Fomes fomentarius]
MLHGYRRDALIRGRWQAMTRASTWSILPLPAVDHAKDLVIHVLDPGSHFSEEEGSAEAEKQKERVGEFRRRPMDLYLLDAFNKSCGDDVLERADLSQRQERDKKGCRRRAPATAPSYSPQRLHFPIIIP